MSTPENHKKIGTPTRFVSKYLSTPGRRVGLCRKTKKSVSPLVSDCIKKKDESKPEIVESTTKAVEEMKKSTKKSINFEDCLVDANASLQKPKLGGSSKETDVTLDFEDALVVKSRPLCRNEPNLQRNDNKAKVPIAVFRETPVACVDERIAKQSTNKPKLKRSLSLKQTSSDENLENVEPDLIMQKAKKSKTDRYRSEDNDLFSSSDSKSVRDLKIEIETLERVVKEKEERVLKLKHISIYRKKHNVKELERVTRVWKIGSQQALRDLLKKLHEKQVITMPQLIRLLNIPEHIVTYNVDKDEFS